MRKICFVTGTRAEYGLLYPLIQLCNKDENVELQLVVTAMHLSPEFGLTIDEIKADGIPICKQVETLMSSDTCIGVSKGVGLGVISFSEVFHDLNPDLIVILGDRTEMLSVAAAALFAGIPIAHISGGETTEGAYDESIRHSITKMSHIHFTAAEPYRRRVLQLGEDPQRVYNVGGLGVDNIKNIKLLNKESFEDSIGMKLGEKNILVTFHPVTLENSTSEEQMLNLLGALTKLKDTNIIFTKPNSDKDGRVIIRLIDEYVNNHDNCVAFDSLGMVRYLSALQFMDIVVGNSSSGISEVPSFGIPTINIGERQKGRVKATSVIDCGTSEDSISGAISLAYSDNFKMIAKNTTNPLGEGNASDEIFDVIKNVSLEDILKKKFYDI